MKSRLLTKQDVVDALAQRYLEVIEMIASGYKHQEILESVVITKYELTRIVNILRAKVNSDDRIRSAGRLMRDIQKTYVKTESGMSSWLAEQVAEMCARERVMKPKNAYYTSEMLMDVYELSS